MNTEIDLKGYRADLPYPEIKVNEKNMKYARILSEDYAGSESELSAITGYIYSSKIIAEKYPGYSSALEKIAIIEMKHLEILAELIIKLGGDPQFRAENKYCALEYWNGGYLSYSKDIKNVILDNIKNESAAIDNYLRHICMISDENIKAILKRIIMDEEIHRKILAEMFFTASGEEKT